MKYPYSYVILRYVHDILSGERLNVGVVVYSADAGYLGASCRPTFLRLSHAFPGLRGEAFKSVSRHIQEHIDKLGETLKSQLSLEEKRRDITALVTSVLPKDESSFQWSEPGFGVSNDLSRTLEELYERLVSRYDEHANSEGRIDDDGVWRRYKRDLEQRRVLKYLKPKRINAAGDEMEYPHAWKNGVWHCLQPVSFDLIRSEKIQEKAHRILGELTSVQDSGEPLKVYLLVGKPQSQAVMSSYERALTILKKATTDKEIVTEEHADAFVERFAREIEEHEGGQAN